MGKVYKYKGQKFKVSEPKDCKVQITGIGQVGEIWVNKANGKYHVSTLVWAGDVSDMKTAMETCCAHLIERSKLPSENERCKEMSAFYDGLN